METRWQRNIKLHVQNFEWLIIPNIYLSKLFKKRLGELFFFFFFFWLFQSYLFWDKRISYIAFFFKNAKSQKKKKKKKKYLELWFLLLAFF